MARAITVTGGTSALAIALAAGAVMLPSGASAQQAADTTAAPLATSPTPANTTPNATVIEPAQDDAPAAGLADIVVTAQKREENLQKVPASITALGSDALQTRQIQNLQGLQAEVPSLVVGEYFGATQVTLRGISTGVTSGAEDPSVATHIDGVYQPRSRTIDSAMVDLERVEVLSGPQGTLYGRNATGGVINYVLRRPSKEFQGEVTGRVANYDRYAVQGRITGPLTEGVNFLLSGIYDNQEKGFTKNLQPNAPRKRLENNRVYGGRAALSLVPADGLDIQLNAIYLDTNSAPTALAFGPSGDATLRATLGTQSFKPREVYSELDSFGRSKYLQTYGTITYDVSDEVTLKSITAYQDFKNHMLIDLDASASAGASSPTDQSIHSKTFTQELNLNANLLDGRLKSIFGLFYYNDDFLGESDTAFVVPGFAAAFVTYSKIKSKSYAAFTDQTFSITDRLRLQGGLRYNYDKKTATQSVFVGGAASCPLATNDRNWDALTPRVGIQYDVTDTAMLYGQWSRGFKSGGFTANSCYDDFDPEKIKGPEIGIKTKLFDNRVRFNLSGYYYDISNLQVQKVVDAGTFFVDNAAAARIYGAEFSLTALLARGLQFDATGMVQSAKYREFENCNETAFFGACGSFDPRPPAARLTDVSGNWLNRAAPYSLNLGLQYTFEFAGGGDLLLRGESYFSGRVHYSEFESPESTQKAYNMQNAFVTYTSNDKQVTVRGYIKNIGQTNVKTSYFFSSSVRQGSGNWAPPRTFGADVTFRF